MSLVCKYCGDDLGFFETGTIEATRSIDVGLEGGKVTVVSEDFVEEEPGTFSGDGYGCSGCGQIEVRLSDLVGLPVPGGTGEDCECGHGFGVHEDYAAGYLKDPSRREPCHEFGCSCWDYVPANARGVDIVRDVVERGLGTP